MGKVECEEEEKRSSEVIEIWWVGFIKDGAWPLSSSSDSVLARVTQLTPRKHKHKHTHTKHMAAVSHAHAHSSFMHTYKCFLQKQKYHQNIVSQCMLIPMKCTHTRIVCQSVSESKPLGDPSSPGVEFLPLLFVLHELLLHLLHRALSRCPLFFWEDVRKSKCLAQRLMRRQRQKAQRKILA